MVFKLCSYTVSCCLPSTQYVRSMDACGVKQVNNINDVTGICKEGYNYDATLKTKIS